MALTTRTVLVALVVTALSLLSPDLAWPLDLGLLAAVVIDLALAATIRDLTVVRGGAATVRLGESALRTLTVHNAGRRRARGLLRDAWVPSTAASPPRLRFEVAAGQSRRLELVVTPTRRGERRTSRITLRSIGPLGLAARQRRRQLAGAVLVLAPFPSRRLLPEKLARLRQVEGEVAIRGAGQGTEVDTLRDYVSGDDARSLDWRATARRGSVVVRTYRPERDRRLLLVLDTGRTCAARVGDTPRLDHAMDAALLLAALSLRAGDRVGLLGCDAVLRADVPAGANRDTLARLVSALTPLQPALVDTDYQNLAAQVLRHGRRRSLVVLFTDLASVVVEESLLPVLGALTRRHTVLVAAVTDPALARLSDPQRLTRDGITGVYQAAAAGRALAERASIAAGLRRRGVEVIDAAPACFASEVADRYLALKAAGRL